MIKKVSKIDLLKIQMIIKEYFLNKEFDGEELNSLLDKYGLGVNIKTSYDYDFYEYQLSVIDKEGKEIGILHTMRTDLHSFSHNDEFNDFMLSIGYVYDVAFWVSVFDKFDEFIDSLRKKNNLVYGELRSMMNYPYIDNKDKLMFDTIDIDIEAISFQAGVRVNFKIVNTYEYYYEWFSMSVSHNTISIDKKYEKWIKFVQFFNTKYSIDILPRYDNF